jgi:ribosomal-protein-alanine N-acetyltransferase
MPGRPFISGDTVDLCAVAEEDLSFFLDNVNDPAVWRTTGSRNPYTEQQEQEWYEAHISADNGHIHFTVADDGDPVGTVSVHGVDDVDGGAEIGIWIGSEYWGNGYGTEAARLATDYAFRDHRRHRVVARVFEDNDASARIWEKLGFDLEGTHRDEVYIDGRYRDVRYYAVLEDEWREREK